MDDFGMIIAVALLAMCGVYFLPKVNCNKKQRKLEDIIGFDVPPDKQDLEYWERMNNL